MRARSGASCCAGSVGTAQATRIDATFSGPDCQQATFTGMVVLTKE